MAQMSKAQCSGACKGVAGLINYCFGVLLLAALAVGSSVGAAGQSVPVAQQHAPSAVAGNLLLAGAGGGRVWLIIPVWLHRGATAQSGFALLDHPVDRRSAGGLVWQQFSGGPLSGTPQALAAVKASRHNVPTAGAYVFFSGGVQAHYTRVGHDLLPTLPHVKTTAAAVGCHDGVFALVYGLKLPAAKRAAKPGQAMGTGAPAAAKGDAAVAGRVAPAAGPPALKKGAPAKVIHPPTLKTAAKSVVLRAGATLRNKAAATGASATGMHWRVVRLLRNRWRSVPKAPFAKLNQTVLARATLGVAHNRLLAAWTTTAVPNEIFIATLPLGKRAKPAGWSPPQVLHVSAAVGQMALISPDGHAMLFWISAPPTGAPMLNSVRVNAAGGTRPSRKWRAQALPSLAGIAGLARNCAVSLDSNSIMVASRQAHTNKVLTETFTPAGRVASPVELVRAKALHPANPDLFQNLVLLSLVLLLGMFLWQRRQRAATQALPPEIRLASLAMRFAAAAIDVAIPLIVVPFIFRLGRLSQWETVTRDWLRLPVAPERIFKDYPLLLTLGLYTLHVLIGESIAGQSIGKWILRIRVVQADGKKAAPGPIVVRNITRPLEIVSGLFLFIFVSEQRQRIGDLLAQTLVVEKNRVRPEAQKVNDQDDDEDEESELLKARERGAS